MLTPQDKRLIREKPSTDSPWKKYKKAYASSTILPKLLAMHVHYTQNALALETIALLKKGLPAYVICGSRAALNLWHTKVPFEQMNHYLGLQRGTDPEAPEDEVQIRGRDDKVLLRWSI